MSNDNNNHASPEPNETPILPYLELLKTLDDGDLEEEHESCKRDFRDASTRIKELSLERGEVASFEPGLLNAATINFWRAYDNLFAVEKEMKERQKAEAERMYQEEHAYEDMMLEARLSAIDQWLDAGGSLTDMIRTAMSITLRMASDLPTEAEYSAIKHGYPDLTACAMEAEAILLHARDQLRQAVETTERALRRINDLKAHVRTETAHGKQYQNAIPF